MDTKDKSLGRKGGSGGQGGSLRLVQPPQAASEEAKGRAEVGPDSSGSKKDGLALREDGGMEKRMVPRFVVSGLVFKHHSTGRLYDVINVSAHGIGIRLGTLASGNSKVEGGHEDLLTWTIGAIVEGHLRLHGEVLDLNAKVVFHHGSRVGCEWVGVDQKTLKKLESLLSPELLGRELRALPFQRPSLSLRGQATSGKAGSVNVPERLWFHGPTGTDVIVEAVPGHGTAQQVTALSVFVLGSFIEWKLQAGRHYGIQTGSIRSWASAQPTGDPYGHGAGQIQEVDALEVQMDLAPSPEKLKIAKTLLLSSNLPDWIKSILGG